MKQVEIKCTFNISESDFKKPEFQKVIDGALEFESDIKKAAKYRANEFKLHNIRASVKVS